MDKLWSASSTCLILLYISERELLGISRTGFHGLTILPAMSVKAVKETQSINLNQRSVIIFLHPQLDFWWKGCWSSMHMPMLITKHCSRMALKTHSILWAELGGWNYTDHVCWPSWTESRRKLLEVFLASRVQPPAEWSTIPLIFRLHHFHTLHIEHHLKTDKWDSASTKKLQHATFKSLMLRTEKFHTSILLYCFKLNKHWLYINLSTLTDNMPCSAHY